MALDPDGTVRVLDTGDGTLREVDREEAVRVCLRLLVPATGSAKKPIDSS